MSENGKVILCRSIKRNTSVNEELDLGIENLNHFFNPKGIAVIGASEREGSLGTKILRNLIGSYQGLVFPVNPFRQKVQGITAYSSVGRVSSKIDLAVIATPAHTVPQIVEECGKVGVSGLIIASAGLDENYRDNLGLVRQILELKRTYGMRILGPNSFGVIRPKINLYATFSEKKAAPGKIAFISQSAALCGSVLDWSSETQVGLSAVVSTGSSLDISVSDLIDYFGADPQTKSIMLYVESIKNVRSFMSAARGYARTKPIVLVKAGRFRENRDFPLSFMDELSGEDALYDAAFRRVGIVRVETMSELFDCAKALSMQPNPRSPSLMIITNAIGPGLMASDELIARGGKLSQISSNSAQALRSTLPHYCRISNPIDILEEATQERFRNVLQVCLNDPTEDNFLIIYTPQGLTDPSDIANITIDLAKQTRKNLLISLMGDDSSCQEARRMLNRNGIPAFRTPEEAVRTFMYMYTYTQNLELLYQTPEELTVELDIPVHLKGIIRRAFCEGRQVLSLPESLRFLEAYKIPTLKTHVALTEEDAVALSSELGYPVVMKATCMQSTCRSEIEELVSDACAPSEVPIVFNKLSDKIKNFGSSTEFQGIAIQHKVRNKGFELFVGSRKDARFGSIILFGTGGTAVEMIRDVSVGFPPLNQVLARQIIESTRVVQHSRVVPSANTFDTGLVEEILIKFSQLLTDFPEIKEVDINPIVADRCGACAVDARVVIDTDRIMREVADHHEHMVITPYPRKYVAKRTLKNGVKVTFRPIKPEDEVRFNELFKSLSEESVRFRFFETIKEMSHDTLTRYCNLDYDREIAIAAELQDDRQIIGVVRLILDSDRKSGEFAIMVSDPWQGLGLGSKLMGYITDIAKDMNLETIYSHVSRDNFKMIGLCSKRGFEMRELDEFTVNMSMTLRR